MKWLLLIAWNANADFVALPQPYETLALCRRAALENVKMTERWYPIQWKCRRSGE